MNKIASIVILLSIVAIGAFVLTRPNNKQTPLIVESTPSAITNSTTPAGERRYVEYSQAAFDGASGKKRVLFFFAPWCPTCVPANKNFLERIDEIPQDVILFKTSYDNEKELKKKYGITYQHTYVLVDDNGNEIKKWNGGAVDEIIANTK